jgi:hypothetical protein
VRAILWLKFWRVARNVICTVQLIQVGGGDACRGSRRATKTRVAYRQSSRSRLILIGELEALLLHPRLGIVKVCGLPNRLAALL